MQSLWRTSKNLSMGNQRTNGRDDITQRGERQVNLGRFLQPRALGLSFRLAF